MRRTLLWAFVIIIISSAPGFADTVTQWNFNFGSDINNVTGTTNPSVGVGSASLFGGTTATFAGGTLNPSQSTDPDAGPDNSAWNVTGFTSASQFSQGVQFDVSTVGFTGISASWDQRHSNSSNKFLGVFYTLNGSSWLQLTNPSLFTAGTISGTVNPGLDSVDPSGLFVGGSGDRFHNQRSVNFSSIAGVDNNPNFAFRIVSAFNPTSGAFAGTNGAFATTGSWRFDMVTVSGTAVPEPSALGLLAVAGVVAGGFRRKRS
jgi:hypothetical protein